MPVRRHGKITDVQKDTQLADTVANTHDESELARGSSQRLSITGHRSILPRDRSGEVPHAGPRFEAVRLLGKGGLGEVSLVRDHDIDRPVAIKRLLGGADDDLYRFTHEVRTVGRLEHPNITPVYDVGVDDGGRHYFVMRYVEGETLEMVIAQLASGDPEYHRKYTFERRVELFLGILNAIQYAHAKHIVHRDIKPANIMVGPYGEVVVMDWGIAKQRSEPELKPREDSDEVADSQRLTATREGSLVGTPLYMAPEQAAGAIDQIDERTDVYALSALFYELLALQHYLPPCSTVPELLVAISEADHQFAAYVANEYQTPVPAELAWFIERGLAKDPADRYQSVTEMLDALHAVIAGGFKIQCPITFMKRIGGDAVKFTDRWPRTAMAMFVAGALLIVFALVELIRLIATA